MKLTIFADGIVGLKLIKFLYKNHFNKLFQIVVTNKESLVYRYLKKKDFKRIIINDLTMLKKCDYFFLLWWPNILEEGIISIPQKGTINIHPSLLPFNRGKNYNFWNIVENVPFGVSIHFIDKNIDSGDILFQKKIKKSWTDTGETLYYKAQKEIITLFKKKFNLIIENKFERKKQDLEKGSFHLAKELDNASQIFLEKKYKGKALINLLRARTFKGYPSCYFYDGNNEKYEIRISIKKVKNDS